MKKYLTEFLGTFVLVFTILNFSNPMFIGVNLAIIIYIGYHFYRYLSTLEQKKYFYCICILIKIYAKAHCQYQDF